jgi:DNA polymerase III subunit alpha
MRKKYKCGCSFGFTEDKIDLDLNLINLNLDCKQTWKLIGSGNTKGCFQLESRLGQTMAKKLKPENIEQLSALISILRPGCLEAYRDGKSVSNHYIDKKNGLESIDYYHESLKDILSTTYGEMIYQEQAMQIAQGIAGFDLQDADMLRKAIGKKKPEEMAKIKKKFLAGCKKINVVNVEQSAEIFNWIEKSQRYSFNKSHAISYAMNAYLSAYVKTHFPKQFFVSYLQLAREKIDPFQEICDLVSNCRQMDIDVCNPDFRINNKDCILQNDKIYFGLTDIKGVGDSVYDKMQTLEIDRQNANYLEIMFKVLDKINKTGAKGMISVGCFDYLGLSRKQMLFDYDIIDNLTAKEKEHIVNNIGEFKNILQCISFVLTKVNVRRKKSIESLLESLKNPAYSLEDSIAWIADTENQLLGISVSCSKIDECDLHYVNTDCRALCNARTFPRNIMVGIEIKDVSVIKTKRGANPGQEMAFVKIADNTGSIDTVIFPEEYKIYRHLLSVDNTTVIKLEPSKKKDDSMIIKKVWQA